VPIGGHGLVQGDHVTLFRVTRSAGRQEAEVLGREVARALLDRGARQVLAEIYSDGASS